MSFSFSITEGKTESISKQASFTVGTSLEFEAGFYGFAGQYGVSFEISVSETLQTSLSKGKQKTYTFPLSVPATTTLKARAIVNEVTLNVPYELVYTIGDVKRIINGMWKGVASSSAAYTIDKVE